MRILLRFHLRVSSYRVVIVDGLACVGSSRSFPLARGAHESFGREELRLKWNESSFSRPGEALARHLLSRKVNDGYAGWLITLLKLYSAKRHEPGEKCELNVP